MDIAWSLLPLGVGLLGAGGYFLLLRGDKVAIGTSVFAEDNRVFNDYLAPAGWVFYPGDNEQDVAEAIRNHSRISRLLLMGHGSANWFFNSTSGILVGDLGYLASELGPKLTAGAVVGLAGCSAAKDAREGTDTVYEDGGADSFAGRFRDALARYAWAPGASVRGHTTAGHITWNASGRSFSLGSSGQPGRAWKPVAVPTEPWRTEHTGVPALAWIIGA